MGLPHLIPFLLLSRRELGLDFLETLSQRLGHDKVHVDGHQHRRGTEEQVDADHGHRGQYVREHLEHREHDEIRVGHQQTAADRPDRGGQQLAYHRPREHEHAQRAAEHEQHDAAQGPRDGGGRAGGGTVGGDHQRGGQRHAGEREHQQRFAAHVERQRAREQTGREPYGAQRGQRVELAHRVRAAGHHPLQYGQRVRYARVGAAQLLQQQQNGQYGHRLVRRGARTQRLQE